ncbi:CLUMA_CG007244, isoform A [Clunio marinus]|uniref:CLUMA_CG007244, isoform A n=1 Tax=Clunio marinus TaxID=568069 RepID=A0A1J1I2A1_9DIPT|nr:CLUMA_CG007244, isoform A [Clunio marinus]
MEPKKEECNESDGGRNGRKGEKRACLLCQCSQVIIFTVVRLLCGPISLLNCFTIHERIMSSKCRTKLSTKMHFENMKKEKKVKDINY